MTELTTEIKAVSFDVFDTVITRCLADPKAVFEVMSKELQQEDGFPMEMLSSFRDERVWAEEEARRSSAAEEIDLDDIYAVLSTKYRLTAGQVELLLQLEINTEYLVSRPLLKTIARITEYRDSGRKIIFVSDMYLPATVVKNLLIVVDAYQEGDGLYVSSEYGVGKWSGNLFKLILQAEEIDSRELFHLGDNSHSDFKIPTALGIRSETLLPVEQTRYEKIFLSDVKTDGVSDGQWIAGAMRVARINSNVKERTLAHQTLFNLGVGVAGPILFGYVAWLLDEAEREGFERLYFVARDGQVLLEIAEVLAERKKQKIELHYLYGSRQAWHLPSLLDIDEDALEWITCQDPVLTLGIVANRLSMEPKELGGILAAAGFAEKDMGDFLSGHEVTCLRQILSGDASMRVEILNRAKFAREVALDYFRQEGLLDNVKWAMVDLGWFGRMHNSLCKILSLYTSQDFPPCFYFGLARSNEKVVGKKPYLFNPSSSPQEFYTGMAFIELLEIFSSADHGSTVAYRLCSNGKVVPVIGRRPAYVTSNWGLSSLREGITSLVNTIGNGPFVIEHSVHKIRLFTLMKLFHSNPSLEEAGIIGEFPFSSDQSETELRQFAPPLTLFETIHGVARYPQMRRLYPSFWISGSRVRSSCVTRIVLSFFSKVFPFVSLVLENNIVKSLSASMPKLRRND